MNDTTAQSEGSSFLLFGGVANPFPMKHSCLIPLGPPVIRHRHWTPEAWGNIFSLSKFHRFNSKLSEAKQRFFFIDFSMLGLALMLCSTRQNICLLKNSSSSDRDISLPLMLHTFSKISLKTTAQGCLKPSICLDYITCKKGALNLQNCKRLWATWSSRRPPLQGVWNEMVCKAPPNPNLLMIQRFWTFSFVWTMGSPVSFHCLAKLPL